MTQLETPMDARCVSWRCCARSSRNTPRSTASLARRARRGAPGCSSIACGRAAADARIERRRSSRAGRGRSHSRSRCRSSVGWSATASAVFGTRSRPPAPASGSDRRRHRQSPALPPSLTPPSPRDAERDRRARSARCADYARRPGAPRCRAHGRDVRSAPAACDPRPLPGADRVGQELDPVVVAGGRRAGRRGRWARGASSPAALGWHGLLDGRRRSACRHRPQPGRAGANDNLSGVAVLAALAERWREAPIEGIRVLLVSAGAEEELQGGIYDFLDAHGEHLDPATTRILTVDTSARSSS